MTRKTSQSCAPEQAAPWVKPPIEPGYEYRQCYKLTVGACAAAPGTGPTATTLTHGKTLAAILRGVKGRQPKSKQGHFGGLFYGVYAPVKQF